jgi:hypothetical protein
MKHILVSGATMVVALAMSGCASMLMPSTWTVSGRSSGGGGGGGIDPVTQAGIDETARQTQEDAQRMSDWLMQQQNQAMQDQANQMAAQASMDASNAAAAAAAAAAASVPPVYP